MLANSEVFGVASSLAKKNQYTGYRSQSLIDLDSAEAKSSTINTVRNTEQDKAEVQSFVKTSKEGMSDAKLGLSMQKLPLESPQTTTQLRIET